MTDIRVCVGSEKAWNDGKGSNDPHRNDEHVLIDEGNE